MWKSLMDRLPSISVTLCAFLSFAIPYIFHSVSKQLHKYGDPPWKEEKSD